MYVYNSNSIKWISKLYLGWYRNFHWFLVLSNICAFEFYNIISKNWHTFLEKFGNILQCYQIKNSQHTVPTAYTKKSFKAKYNINLKLSYSTWCIIFEHHYSIYAKLCFVLAFQQRHSLARKWKWLLMSFN